MLIRNVIIAFSCCVALLACGKQEPPPQVVAPASAADQPTRRANNEPTDAVNDVADMIVYSVQLNPNVNASGKYIYWVRDNSNTGWILVTNSKYNLGDKLMITLAAASVGEPVTPSPSLDEPLP